MTYAFSVQERLQILNTIGLVKGWKFEEQISKRALLKEINISEEEVELYEMKTETKDGMTSFHWNLEKAQTKEITLTEGQKAVLRKLFTALDEQEQAVDQLVELYLLLKEEVPTEK
jgi:hypothetical protein